MEDQLTGGTLLFSIGVCGLIVSAILVFANKEETLSTQLLAGLTFSLSLIVISNAAYTTSFFLEHPDFYRLFSFLGFCLGPFSYLYVRTVLDQSLKLRFTDWILFIPAALYFIHRLPFTLAPASVKYQFIEAALKNLQLIALEPEGLLPQGWAAVGRLFTGIGFTIGQIFLLTKWKREKINANQIKIPANQERYKWLVTLTFILAIGYLMVLVETIFHFNKIPMPSFIAFTIAIIILIISISIFSRPRILYGMTGWTQEISESSEDQNENATSKISRLTSQQREEFAAKLEQWKHTDTSFLNQGFAIRDLSLKTGIPVYQLSSFINQEFDKSFNTFLNDARIEYFLESVKKENNFSQITIQAIGESLGFRSRTSFISAVKMRTGKTPSEILGKQQ